MSAQEMPAIAGGEKVKTAPYGKEARYGAEELEQLREALEQGSLFYAHGRKVKDLEAAVAAKVGAKYAVACSSGTAAIHSAMIAAGISPGDEVITGPITDMGSLIPILYQGAVPVFADVDPHTYNIDPASVAVKITERTRSVLAIHLAGNACALDGLSTLCAERGIALIEDCAQVWGATYRGRHVGTAGAMGCFSLNEFKHIACGDGGLIVTDDERLAKRLRLATDKAYNREAGAAVRDSAFLANNYRMTELQGAVGLAQLPKLDRIVSRRRAWCGELTARLAGVPGLSLPRPTEGCDPSWWFYLLRVVPEELGADADTFAEALRAEGLPAGAHYIGRCVYEYPVFTEHSAFERGGHAYCARTYGHGLCPTAEDVLETAVLLSINEAYTETDLDETARAITRAARWYAGQRGNEKRDLG